MTYRYMYISRIKGIKALLLHNNIRD